MKRIEDIERLSIDDLENRAKGCMVEVPSDLSNRVKAAIAVSELYERRKPTHPAVRIISGAFAIAAACLAVILIVSQRPEDTYSDPKLAYAELEKTFGYISSKMNKGFEIASTAEPVIEKTNNVINKTK